MAARDLPIEGSRPILDRLDAAEAALAIQQRAFAGQLSLNAPFGHLQHEIPVLMADDVLPVAQPSPKHARIE